MDAATAELKATGYEAYGAVFDVTDEAAVIQAFQSFEAQGLAVDILINNAGISSAAMVELDVKGLATGDQYA